MREQFIEQMKEKLDQVLRTYLKKEGVEVYLALNDNYISPVHPAVFLHAIDHTPLEGKHLLQEIHIILDILGKPGQCDELIEGIYQALQPHQLSSCELSVLLMSVHVEIVPCDLPLHCARKRTMLRYLLEAA